MVGAQVSFRATEDFLLEIKKYKKILKIEMAAEFKMVAKLTLFCQSLR
jgi:hypothetical protein